MISVLMCVKTGWQYFPEAYMSLLRQEHVDWELLIGVNGFMPVSEAYKYIESFVTQDKGMYARGKHDVRLLDLPQFTSKPTTANHLVTLAKGSHIAILDVDDAWHPWKLALQLPYLRDYGVVGTMGEYFGDIVGPIGIRPGPLTFDMLLQQNDLLHSSVVLSKRYAEWPITDDLDDYPLWLYLAEQGIPMINVGGEALVRIRQHSEQHFPKHDNSIQIRAHYQQRKAARQ